MLKTIGLGVIFQNVCIVGIRSTTNTGITSGCAPREMIRLQERMEHMDVEQKP